MINLTINGEKVAVAPGATILDAAKQIGVDIPTFCHDERLVGHGACRICVVEVKGARSLLTACTTPASEGMEVQTESAEVVESRKDILNLLWVSHDNDCLTCNQAGNCKLQDYSYRYDIKPEGTLIKKRLSKQKDSTNQFYEFDRDKCILCGKCVRVCDELQGTGAINFSERGFHTHISHPFEKGMEYSSCVSCGNCVNACPTGALSEKSKSKFRSWELDRKVRTTCSYCGVGCQVELQVKNNKVVGVEPVYSKVNDGMLCVKGRFAYNFISHPDRLKTPLIRKNGELVESSWDEAFDLITEKIKDTKEKYGARSLAALTSARCTTEDNYMLQKLFRAVIGTNSIDHCARL